MSRKQQKKLVLRALQYMQQKNTEELIPLFVVDATFKQGSTPIRTLQEFLKKFHELGQATVEYILTEEEVVAVRLAVKKTDGSMQYTSMWFTIEISRISEVILV
jgi:hypothetical protein